MGDLCSELDLRPAQSEFDFRAELPLPGPNNEIAHILVRIAGQHPVLNDVLRRE